MARSRPLDLTAGSRWEFRAVCGEAPTPWCSTLAAAVRGLAPRFVQAPWVRTWRAFARRDASPGSAGTGLLEAPLPEPHLLREPAESLTLAGETLDRADLVPDRDGAVDLAAAFGPPRDSRIAWLFAARESPRDERLVLHLGADWWMQLFVDGMPVFDTAARGNGSPLLGTAHRVSLELPRGRHCFAVRVRSGNGGWAFASAASRVAGRPGPPLRVEARRRIAPVDPSGLAALTLLTEGADRVRINGAAPPLPLAGLTYHRIDGIPPTLLRGADDFLTCAWDEAESAAGAALVGLRGFRHSGAARRLVAAGRLLGVAPAAVAVRTGPFAGPAGTDHLGLSCRLDAPAAAELAIAGRTLRSPPGIYHRFRVEGLAPGRAYPWRLRAVGSQAASRGALRTLPAAGEVRIALFSDPSPQPRVLARTIAAMSAWRPHLAIGGGDFTSDGRSDQAWDDEFHALDRRWWAAVPHLWVVGNHEEGTPLFPRLFLCPGADPAVPGPCTWTTSFRGLRLIGIDGMEDWSAGSANTAWLEGVLRAADEPFVVFLDHYPAWSSTGHAAPGPDGRPRQRPVREAREVLLPLLERHRASAFINGHAHCYERSLPPGGVPCITSGGAGGFLYPDAGAGTNPYRQVMASRHHWCRLRLSEGALALEAIALDDGAVIDSLVFAPRR